MQGIAAVSYTHLLLQGAIARDHGADFAPADLTGALPAGLLGRWGLPPNMVQLIPCQDGTDGFFIAAFDRKEASTCS